MLCWSKYSSSIDKVLLSTGESSILDCVGRSYGIINFVYVHNFWNLYDNRRWYLHWDWLCYSNWNRVWYLNSYGVGNPDVHWPFYGYFDSLLYWYWVWFVDWVWYVHMYWHRDRTWYLDWVWFVYWNWHMYIIWNRYCLFNWNWVGVSDWHMSGDLDWYWIGLSYTNLIGDGVYGVDVFLLDSVDVMLSVNI